MFGFSVEEYDPQESVLDHLQRGVQILSGPLMYVRVFVSVLMRDGNFRIE